MASQNTPDTISIEEFADAAEFGARANHGIEGRFVGAIALTWALFQLWFASPLPYVFNFLIFNDTQARLIHLAFAIFLAFAVYPIVPRHTKRVPIYDWLFGVVAAALVLFGLIFYQELARRAGKPIFVDLAVSFVGILLVLEAARRSMGPFLVLVALVFLVYSFAGRHMPEVLQHRGASLTRILEHQWLSSQGIFGVPLGASTAFVFIYVLFGTLFNKAGAGHYIMQLSLAFLGHFRGGPAKVAVVSSGLNGLISGSALANVVATGIFTIPLMKKTGISAVKAGAVETSASINGQIMPPVMGAAAFIMVEYVGIPYVDVIRHAFLPAIISYISLFYIVHLESVKTGLEPTKRADVTPFKKAMLRYGLGISATFIVVGLVYFIVSAITLIAGAYTGLALGVLITAIYGAALVTSAAHADLPPEDPDDRLDSLPRGWEVARTGLHLLIPVIVLVWCLIVARFSPSLAAFWASVSVFVILLTQEPLKCLIRREQGALQAMVDGFKTIVEGLILAARNMVGIALATSVAGLIVGTITLTGLGLMMTDAVGLLSGGNIYLVLLLTALVTLILGCGVPTTANYVLVATLIAPVIVELGSEAGIAVPLIGAHLFVFYFGIMADATPPVGLGAYAAAALSGASPIATAVQASIYSFRTALLAFVMIFNPEIMLINIDSVWHGIAVAIATTIGVLAFAAGTLNFWVVRNKLWETLVLLLVAVSLVYPAMWLDMVYDKYSERPPLALFNAVENVVDDGRLVVRFKGTSIEGDTVSRIASLRLGPAGSAIDRLAFSGLSILTTDEKIAISQVRFGSYAARVKLEPGFQVTKVLVPAERPFSGYIYGIALALLSLVWLSQRRRKNLSSPRSIDGVDAPTSGSAKPNA